MQALDTFGQTVGRLEGWLQFDDSDTGFRYSLTLYRQSAYAFPQAIVQVGSTTYRNLSTGSSETASADVRHTGVIRNVSLHLVGNQMINTTFTEYPRNATVDNPFN